MRDLVNLITQRGVFEEGIKAALQLAAKTPLGESKQLALQSQVATTRTCLYYFLKNTKKSEDRQKFLKEFIARAPWFANNTNNRLIALLSADGVANLSSKNLQEHALVFGATADILKQLSSV